MNRNLNIVFSCLFGVILIVLPAKSWSQCVVINEILINGPGACDGSCNPEVEEWVELYNTCTNSVDISCYVLADGDFTVTFPAGTTIAAGGYLVIGSVNSGGMVNINLATCNCTSGTLIGTYTNGNEQVLLLNAAGVVQDAVYWGSGQFPVVVSSPAIFGCTALNFTANSFNEAGFEQIPGGGTNGCTIARGCDGSLLWEERCNTGITMGAQNGSSAIPDFVSSENTICPGDCINYTYTGAGVPNSYFWEFPGSLTEETDAPDPTSICYTEGGIFMVSLTITDDCGSSTIVANDFINVESIETPVIVSDGPTELCNGGSVTFSTTASGNLQWYLNDVPIENANSNSYTTSEAGAYNVSVITGICEFLSNQIEVLVGAINAPVISPDGPLVLCGDQSIILSTGQNYEQYTWYLNGAQIQPNAGFFVEVSEAGLYEVEVSVSSCSATSESTEIITEVVPTVELTPIDGIVICEGESAVLQASPDFVSYEWFINGLPAPSLLGDQITPDVSGNYSVEVSNGTCNASSNEVTVEILSLPVVSIEPSGSITICDGGMLNLQASPGAASYQWFLNDVEIEGQTFANLDVSSSGMYSVLFVGENGCEALSETVSVVLENTLSVEIQSSTGSFEACQDENLILSATGVWTSFQWTLNGTFLSSNPSIQAIETGTYGLSASTNSNCDATDEVVVTIVASIVPIISPSGPIQLCAGESVVLTSNTDVLFWSLNGFPLSMSSVNQWTATQSGNYTAFAGSANCASSSSIVSVNIDIPVNAQISVSDASPCAGETVTLSVSGTNFNSVLWSNTSQNLSISITLSGTYSVTVTSPNDCSASDSETIVFTATPIANAGPDLYNNCLAGVQIQATASGGIISWSPSDELDNPAAAQPFANPAETTSYQITVTNGECVASDEVTVVSNCNFIFVPNVFTPNGDGKNDFFDLKITGAEEFEFTIYDRRGMSVFESTNPENRWTGRTNGQDLPEGTYFYVLKATDFAGKAIPTKDQESGTITLLR